MANLNQVTHLSKTSTSPHRGPWFAPGRLALAFLLVPNVLFDSCPLSELSGTQVHAEDLSGVWHGQWTAAATGGRSEHSGSLRVRLIPLSGGSYQGRFSGRFAVVIPYFYRAEVHQQGRELWAVKRLGPLGSYQMRLTSATGRLVGTWEAGSNSGRIQLRKRR